jgi:hypothetical protein
VTAEKMFGLFAVGDEEFCGVIAVERGKRRKK